MNQLSWLIYFADITNTLGGWMTFFAVVGFILSLISVCSALFCEDSGDRKTGVMASWLAVPLFFFLLIGSIMVPSRDTVLAIAASEMGEKFLADPRVQQTGTKAFSAINHWIDSQTKDDPAPRDDRERDDRR